jgi:DNA mismatch repair protein MSH4
MRHQECFALKPNTDGMMDVLRKAFLANVDDIYRLADEYAETYDIHVQVKETTSRGYYLSVSADLGLDLPQIFIQPVKNGRFIYCTTEEVSYGMHLEIISHDDTISLVNISFDLFELRFTA